MSSTYVTETYLFEVYKKLIASTTIAIIIIVSRYWHGSETKQRYWWELYLVWLMLIVYCNA